MFLQGGPVSQGLAAVLPSGPWPRLVHPVPLPIHAPCPATLCTMLAFFTPLNHCYVLLFCCEIQSHPGFTARLPHQRIRAWQWKFKKDVWLSLSEIQMGRGTDRVAGWLISEEHTRFCLGSNLSSGIVKSRHSPQSDLSYIYHFLLSFSLPILGIAGRLEVYWIFWLPFPSNRMQSDNSSKISPLLNVLPSGYIQIIQTLLEIRNESAISAGQYALCLF